MPSKPKKPCSHPGCMALTAGGPCPAHKKKAEQDRGSASARGYNALWRKIRLMVLREEPCCRHCAKAGRVTAARHVDHIDGDVTNISRENLQPLCVPCHGVKSVREQGALGHYTPRNVKG